MPEWHYEEEYANGDNPLPEPVFEEPLVEIPEEELHINVWAEHKWYTQSSDMADYSHNS